MEGSPASGVQRRVQQLEFDLQLRELRHRSSIASGEVEHDQLSVCDAVGADVSGQLLRSYGRNSEKHIEILQRELGMLEVQAARSSAAAKIDVDLNDMIGRREGGMPAVRAPPTKCDVVQDQVLSILEQINALSYVVEEMRSAQACRDDHFRGRSPGPISTLCAENDRSASDYAKMQQDMDALTRMITEANAARETMEQELVEARRQLPAALARIQRMQEQHNVQKTETLRVVTSLLEEISQLNTAANCLQLLPPSRPPANWNHRRFNAGLYSPGASSGQSVATNELTVEDPGDGSSRWAQHTSAQAPANIRALVLHLDMRMSYVGEVTRFEQELLEELAWAADVEVGQLRVLRVEAGTQHKLGSASRHESGYPASFVVAEIEVGVGGTGWTAGNGGHTGPGMDVKSGSHILESLSEQLRQMKTATSAPGLLGMGVHTSRILRVFAVDDDCAAQQTRGPLHACNAVALVPPSSPCVHTQPGPPSLLQPAVQAQAREEVLLQEEVEKIKGWARDEVASERRQSLHLHQQLEHALMLQHDLQARLDDAVAEARSERHERMRFAATYIKGVDFHRAQLEQKEGAMWNSLIKTERLLSQISSQTRAAYSSLCALCVRSRLEIEQHKQRARENLALVDQYRQSCRALELDRKAAQLSSLHSSSARLHLAQTMGLAMEDLVSETSEMIREVEGVQKQEVVLQSVSEYLKERLLQSCKELDDVEGQLDRSLEETSVLQRTCENQMIEISGLQHDFAHQGHLIDQYQQQFSDTSNMALDLANASSRLLLRADNLAGNRFRRHSRRKAWCHWRLYLRRRALWKTVDKLAANTRGRRREDRCLAACLLHKWGNAVESTRNRRRFGAFLWTFARRSSCLRLYTRVLRVWRAYLLIAWRFKLCARTHARLHRLLSPPLAMFCLLYSLFSVLLTCLFVCAGGPGAC